VCVCVCDEKHDSYGFCTVKVFKLKAVMSQPLWRRDVKYHENKHSA
jgi:hypothetical protein